MKQKIATLLVGVLVGWTISFSAASAPLNIANVPLFLPGAVPPLNMLVMGRDHTLFYEAYNDAADLTGDGLPDVGYKPDRIDYYGYFDSRKCYAYVSASGRFEPQSVTLSKRCSGQWSGDFLNYLTTSRIDALRKVLYGGKRSTDSSTETVLERSFIPQDAHSWGKEYESIAHDGYDIRDYTPLDLPNSGRRHLFANTTLFGTANPLMRVLRDQGYRIWDWVSIERPVAGRRLVHGGTGPDLSAQIENFQVRALVCSASMPETNCKRYPDGNYKPTGLLQDFGENDQMLFGLLTGSYANSVEGGVLRRNIESIKDEIDANNGTFIALSPVGLIGAIDRLRIAQFIQNDYSYYPGWSGAWVTTRPMNNGEFQDWGNPVAEMMYETLRYFANQGTPSAQFSIASTGNTDAALGLPLASWDKPYDEYPSCSPAVQTVISGIYPSYDTDSVPGSYFSSYTGDLTGLNASNVGDRIWSEEYGSSRDHFIGQSGATYDGAPTAKTVNSFGNIRGLAPEEPTKLGGYYAGSVAYHGLTTDLVPSEDGKQNVSSYVVALASPLPRIEIPVGGGEIVTLVPFAKSVRELGIDRAQGRFQPTNTIVDFYVDSITPTTGRFRVNFEDVEQGADHDMDAIAIYDYSVSGGKVDVTVTSEYAAGGIEQHMGYVISGTTEDGIYLEVRDVDTSDAQAVTYFLDTPDGTTAGTCAVGSPPLACSTVLPRTSHTRTFTPSGASAATLLRDPLWYAAKWGGFKDENANDLPDLTSEWDPAGTGTPSNYFLVTNALTLKDQLTKAFDTIMKTTSSASAVATNSTRLDTETLIYQARFRSDDWTGQLLAYHLEPTGALGAIQWDAADQIPLPANRRIFTRNGTVPGAAAGVPFLWSDLNTTQQAALDKWPGFPLADGRGAQRVDWLRGDQSLEKRFTGGIFRNRRSVLGDIINSDPQFVGSQDFGYDSLPTGTAGQASYAAFHQSKLSASNTVLKPMIYFGANDGMLHGVDAVTGVERLAYVPSTQIDYLNQLTDPSYRHRYMNDGQIYVGDAYITRASIDRWATVLVGTTGAGGRTVYALDVTDPHDFKATDVMWEFTDPDLGYTIGQPSVARMPDGTWVAVFGNGYSSDNQRAVLFIVRLSDGVLLKKIDTLAGNATTPNGLTTPSLLADNTRTIRTIYAGDLLGNMWKFDVSAVDSTSWAVAYTESGLPAPLFVARDADGNRQPITGPTEIGRHPRGGFMVYFGTGKFFETGDNVVGVDPPLQAFYGVWDKTGAGHITYPATDRDAVLTRQTILYEGKPSNSAFNVRVTSANAVDWDYDRGWYMDLQSPNLAEGEGERVVSLPILRGGRIIFPTLIPSQDPCGVGGKSWLMEISALTGERLLDSPLDITEDGAIDSGDFVTVTLPDNTTVTVPVSAVESREGIIDTPAVITAGAMEYKLASGTSGNVEVLRERGLFDRARGSWRQIR